jgi:putative PIN family toxin of toxin-antitoxin system
VRIVVDTNILVSAMLRGGTAPRRVLELCLQSKVTPLIGNALFSEYLDVLARADLFKGSALDGSEREELLDAFLSAARWTAIHYRWRPNLRDEADNHVMELAVAGGAEAIVTANTKDLDFGELLFPSIRVMTAGAFLAKWRSTWER